MTQIVLFFEQRLMELNTQELRLKFAKMWHPQPTENLRGGPNLALI
jgi:hypothetical protein